MWLGFARETIILSAKIALNVNGKAVNVNVHDAQSAPENRRAPPCRQLRFSRHKHRQNKGVPLGIAGRRHPEKSKPALP